MNPYDIPDSNPQPIKLVICDHPKCPNETPTFIITAGYSAHADNNQIILSKNRAIATKVFNMLLINYISAQHAYLLKAFSNGTSTPADECCNYEALLKYKHVTRFTDFVYRNTLFEISPGNYFSDKYGYQIKTYCNNEFSYAVREE